LHEKQRNDVHFSEGSLDSEQLLHGMDNVVGTKYSVSASASSTDTTKKCQERFEAVEFRNCWR
jgi:hypothetical protein